MTAKNQNIEISERETKTIDPSPLTDENGDVVNLVDAELEWVVVDNGQTLVSKDTSDGVTITNASEGEWEISLVPSDTDGYGGTIARHEGRLIDQEGRESVVTKGKFTIEVSDT